MKEKWTKLFAFLGKTKVESTADGIFMTEEEVDFIESMRVENETLAAAVQSEKDARIKAEQNAQAAANALTEKETELNSKITAMQGTIDSLNADIVSKNTEIDELKAGETSASGKPDPDPSGNGKKAKSKWDILYAKSAAGLRGEDVNIVEEVEEEDEA